MGFHKNNDSECLPQNFNHNVISFLYLVYKHPVSPFPCFFFLFFYTYLQVTFQVTKKSELWKIAFINYTIFRYQMDLRFLDIIKE